MGPRARMLLLPIGEFLPRWSERHLDSDWLDIRFDQSELPSRDREMLKDYGCSRWLFLWWEGRQQISKEYQGEGSEVLLYRHMEGAGACINYRHLDRN